jgi:hypothetical protein
MPHLTPPTHLFTETHSIYLRGSRRHWLDGQSFQIRCSKRLQIHPFSSLEASHKILLAPLASFVSLKRVLPTLYANLGTPVSILKALSPAVVLRFSGVPSIPRPSKPLAVIMDSAGENTFIYAMDLYKDQLLTGDNEVMATAIALTPFAVISQLFSVL